MSVVAAVVGVAVVSVAADLVSAAVVWVVTAFVFAAVVFAAVSVFEAFAVALSVVLSVALAVVASDAVSVLGLKKPCLLRNSVSWLSHKERRESVPSQPLMRRHGIRASSLGA